MLEWQIPGGEPLRPAYSYTARLFALIPGFQFAISVHGGIRDDFFLRSFRDHPHRVYRPHVCVVIRDRWHSFRLPVCVALQLLKRRCAHCVFAGFAGCKEILNLNLRFPFLGCFEPRCPFWSCVSCKRRPRQLVA